MASKLYTHQVVAEMVGFPKGFGKMLKAKRVKYQILTGTNVNGNWDVRFIGTPDSLLWVFHEILVCDPDENPEDYDYHIEPIK